MAQSETVDTEEGTLYEEICETFGSDK